jgi:hypothetical protein
MNDIVTFGNAKLPSVQSLSKALRSLEHEVGGSGMAILKMDKTGHWVYGADQTEVEETSTWAVNPFSFVHGYIAWGDGEVLAEKMVPVADPLPELDPAPPNAKKGWELQVGASLKCMSGEDKGLEVVYNVTSVGGKRAVQKLALDIAAQVEQDQSKPVPVVRLKKEHYTHKSYGRIFTPVFDITAWVSLDGQAEETPASEAPVETPTRRRRGA